ncbi:WD40/YVTN/BNR-like repeat-containing protein [Streptomyces sp. NPDC127098]|uniref:WD40/YVTN/BNR-like repeat-containing protein n=1 Tax=Streptomyces sp. NPDC127098 TaxID=3347137 RepID=UPI00365BDBBA
MVLLTATATLLGCTAPGGSAQDRNDDREGFETPPPSLDPTTDPSAEPPAVPSGTELPGQAFSLRLVDETNAFALVTECAEDTAGLPGAEGSERCAYRVAVLEDGAAWEVRDTPIPAGDSRDVPHSLEAAGPGVARLSAVLDDGVERHWVTTDGARSWRPAETTGATGPAEEIPEGAILTAGQAGLAVLMPDTAEYRLLAAQPPLDNPGWPGILPDGSFWTSGVDPDTGRRALAVSRDRGRAWELLPLPTTAGVTSQTLTAGPDALYVFESGTARAGDGTGVLAIHRSVDDGVSWEPVWTYRPGTVPHIVLGTPIAAADGSLLMYASDAIYRSDNAGRDWAISRPGSPPERPEVTPAGFLLTDLTNPGHYRLSADGFTWRTVVLGQGR